MAKLINRIRNVFDNHLEGPGKESLSESKRFGRSPEEDDRVAEQAAILNQNLCDDVKNRWVSDLATGVAPPVALAYAAGRIEQFNSQITSRPARIDVGVLQAEVTAIADRLRADHLRARIAATRESSKEALQESPGMKL